MEVFIMVFISVRFCTSAGVSDDDVCLCRKNDEMYSGNIPLLLGGKNSPTEANKTF